MTKDNDTTAIDHPAQGTDRPESPAAGTGSLAARPAPLSGVAAVRAVFRISALSPVRRKRGVILFILAMLPVVLIVIADLFGAERGGGSKFFTVGIVPVYHYIEMVIFIFLGCSVLGDDMETRTLAYDLICPVSRLAIFAGRYLTYLVSALLLVLPALTAVFFACMTRYGFDALAHSLPLLFAVLVAATVGALVYGSAFVFLSLLTKRAVLAAVIITICIEGFLAHMPFRICSSSVLYHLRNLMVAISGETWFFPMADFDLAVMNEIFEVTLSQSVTTLSLLWVGFTVGGVMLFNRKQFP